MRVSTAKRKRLEEAERQQIAALRAYLDSFEEDMRTSEWQGGVPSVIAWPEFSLEDAS